MLSPEKAERYQRWKGESYAWRITLLSSMLSVWLPWPKARLTGAGAGGAGGARCLLQCSAGGASAQSPRICET